jgi:hypothetical protein
MAGRLYGYPLLDNYGLGHILPAWARCVVWTRANGVPMIAPRWLHPRVGPYLRGDRDKRDYFRFFSNDGYVRGLKRAFLLARAERQLCDRGGPAEAWQTDGNRIAVFRNRMSDNDKYYFPDFVTQHRMLHGELLRITRPRYRPVPKTRPELAIHVRLGDFKAVDTKGLMQGNTNTRIPLDWYVEALKAVRASFGAELTPVVYSEGSAEELAPLLACEGVRRAPARPAVTDMLSIAQSDLLIASASGFSIWGRFLGQVPSISFPGQRRLNANLSGLEIEWASGNALPADFVRGTKTRTASG